MPLTADLRQSIRKLELDLLKKNKEIDYLNTKLRLTKKDTDRIYLNMNFRERKLNGWFGGDKNKIEKYRKNLKIIAELQDKIDQLVQETENINARITNDISNHLRANDSQYYTIAVPYEASQKMKSSVVLFLEKIDYALEQISNASNMELLDLTTKNRAIAALSVVENNQTNEAINEVKMMTPHFIKEVNTYNESLTKFKVKITADVDDCIDFIFDIVSDNNNIDFLSISSLISLDNAESQLQSVRSEVVKIEKIVSAHLEKQHRMMQAHILSARASCA